MNKIKKKYLLVLPMLLGLLGFLYLQKNAFSKESLKLEILGPETADVGQTVEYVLKYKNNSEITLTAAKLIFEYPPNSLVTDSKLRVEKDLPDIYPGQEQSFNFSARLLGAAEESKKAQAWLSFQPRNLKARYEVSTTQTCQLKFSPLTFDLEFPSRLEPEKNFTISLNYFSNIDYPLSQLRARIEYPEGFEFVSSQPSSLGNNEWLINVLNKAQGGRIQVTGRILGGVGEQKIFKASLGLWQEGDFVLLKEATRGAEIIKPNIYVSQLINGDLNYSAKPGDALHYEIFFKNIGQSPFENLFLVTQLTGDFFDFDSLRVQGATYRSGDNSLIWDWKNNPQLKFLGENEEGKVEFWVALKDGLPPASLVKNPFLKDRVSLSPASEEFLVKVGSKIDLTQQVFYNDEVFGNSGPLPPQAGQPTTYTVIWRLKSSYNDLRDVRVRAVLPANVNLTGQLFPREAKFLFDSQSREVVWEVGDLLSVAGETSGETSLSFQISLTPSSDSRGLAAEIIKTAKATGDDAWIQEIVSADVTGAKTDGLSDSGFVVQNGIIQ